MPGPTANPIQQMTIFADEATYASFPGIIRAEDALVVEFHVQDLAELKAGDKHPHYGQGRRDRYATWRFGQDGWAIGDKKFLAEKPAALRAPLGKGQVVLIGFTPDTRGQSRNAFKLIFNPLYASTAKEVSRPTTTHDQP